MVKQNNESPRCVWNMWPFFQNDQPQKWTCIPILNSWWKTSCTRWFGRYPKTLLEFASNRWKTIQNTFPPKNVYRMVLRLGVGKTLKTKSWALSVGYMSQTHMGQSPEDISKFIQEMAGSHTYNPNTPWKNTYFKTIDPHFQLNTSQFNSFNGNKNMILLIINLYSICRTWACFDW